MICSMGVYVQYDGLYWHGLDRTIDRASEPLYPHDRVVLGTMERDVKQNTWFKEKGLKLVRLREDAMRIIDTTHDCVQLISSLVERS